MIIYYWLKLEMILRKMSKTIFHLSKPQTHIFKKGEYIYLESRNGKREDYIIVHIIDQQTFCISLYTWYWKLWHLITFRYAK
jgi:hypothetical protein